MHLVTLWPDGYAFILSFLAPLVSVYSFQHVQYISDSMTVVYRLHFYVCVVYEMLFMRFISRRIWRWCAYQRRSKERQCCTSLGDHLSDWPWLPIRLCHSNFRRILHGRRHCWYSLESSSATYGYGEKFGGYIPGYWSSFLFCQILLNSFGTRGMLAVWSFIIIAQ